MKKITLREFLIYTKNLDKFIVNYNNDNTYSQDIGDYLDNWNSSISPSGRHISAFIWNRTSEGSTYWGLLHNMYDMYIHNDDIPLLNDKIK